MDLSGKSAVKLVALVTRHFPGIRLSLMNSYYHATYVEKFACEIKLVFLEVNFPNTIKILQAFKITLFIKGTRYSCIKEHRFLLHIYGVHSKGKHMENLMILMH